MTVVPVQANKLPSMSPFAVYDQRTRSWISFAPGSSASSGSPPPVPVPWPAVGSVRNGQAFCRSTGQTHCFGGGFSSRSNSSPLFPTPLASNSHGARPKRQHDGRRRMNLNDTVANFSQRLASQAEVQSLLNLRTIVLRAAVSFQEFPETSFV